jgi:hypothetical protein
MKINGGGCHIGFCFGKLNELLNFVDDGNGHLKFNI